VKISRVRLGVIICVIAVAAFACHKSENPTASTETIAPATAQPAPSGTEEMTQTVNVEDGRSEADGGVLTTPSTTSTPVTDTIAADTAQTATAATTTVPTKPPAPKPPKKQ
jgi:hypothetical protein